MKNRLRRRWQITRELALKAEFHRLQWSVTRRVNELRNSQSSATLESLHPEDQSLWRMTKRVIRIPTPSPPLITPGGFAHLDSEKAESLADNLETQFQLVTDASFPPVIEMVDLRLRSYLMEPASEHKITNPKEIQESIRGLKVSKASDPKGLPNRASKHLPQRAVSLLVLIIKAIHLTHHFPTVWKHCIHPIVPLVFWT